MRAFVELLWSHLELVAGDVEGGWVVVDVFYDEVQRRRAVERRRSAVVTDRHDVFERHGDIGRLTVERHQRTHRAALLSYSGRYCNRLRPSVRLSVRPLLSILHCEPKKTWQYI